MDVQYKSIGKRIKLRRKELNIKQNELAEKLNISNNHLSSVENGREKPSLELLLNICELLKKIDEPRYNRLKELGAPEIILKSELAPLNCDYGIISSKEFQNQIENILQPLKVEYSILDSEENIIQEYKI